MYGLVVKGINDKRKFDTKTKSMKKLEGGELSNPIIAGWITAFIRTIISELLNYTNKLIKSKLENTLLTIGIINIICGLLLFNIVVVYHKGEQFFRNNLNKIILIVSVLIYFLCLYLNIYYLYKTVIK